MRVGIINYRYPVFENGSQVQETVNSIAADPEVEQVVMMAACYPSKNFYCPSNVSVVWVPLVTVPVLSITTVFISCDSESADSSARPRRLNACTSAHPQAQCDQPF